MNMYKLEVEFTQEEMLWFAGFMRDNIEDAVIKDPIVASSVSQKLASTFAREALRVLNKAVSDKLNEQDAQDKQDTQDTQNKQDKSYLDKFSDN